jgi:hypothetical protein
MSIRQHRRHFRRQRYDAGSASEIERRMVLRVFQQLGNLLREAERLGRVVLLPALRGGHVVHAAQHARQHVCVAHAQPRRLWTLQRLQNKVLHPGLIQLAHDERLSRRWNSDARILEALDGAHQVLPVLRRLAVGDNATEGGPAVGKDVAVQGNEGKCDFAESDFDGLSFEFGVVFLAVYEVLLLFSQVAGQQNLGVECGEERGELGGRGFKEDGEGACDGVLAEAWRISRYWY